MERRLGSVLILITHRESAARVNETLSDHADIVLGRQGLVRSNGQNLIAVILEGTTDRIGSLTGRLGVLAGIQVKSCLLKNTEL